MRRWIVAGVIVGLLAGSVVAITVPRTREAAVAAGSAVPDAPRPAPAGDPAHPRIAPARPEPRDPDLVRLRARGPLRVETRARDPRGGPPWAVRVFVAERNESPAIRRPHSDGVIGRDRCAQLGRLYHGRFGWIDATNTFRPVKVSFLGAPTICDSRRPDLHRQPDLQVFDRITDPAAGVAAPLQTVAWGMVGHEGRLRLRFGDRTLTPHAGRHGAFVAVGSPKIATSDVRGVVRYPGGVRVAVGSDPHRAALQFGGRIPHFRLPRAGARARLEIRAPDPNGGLAFGVSAVEAEHGGWCLSAAGRVVGDRVGDVDYERGMFREALVGFRCPEHRYFLTRERPVDVGSAYSGSFGEPGDDPLAGRVARRTLRGISEYQGLARRDVASITVASPRDVRTIVPSRRAHAFFVVYDGTFPTGDTVFTSTFRDGGSDREVIHNATP